MRFFHPFGQYDISRIILLRYSTQSINVVQLRTAGTSSFNLNQDNFKEVATFESAVRLGVVFTNRHQVNDARRLSPRRTGKAHELPTLCRLDGRRAQPLAAALKTDAPFGHRERPFGGPNGRSDCLREIRLSKIAYAAREVKLFSWEDGFDRCNGLPAQ